MKTLILMTTIFTPFFTESIEPLLVKPNKPVLVKPKVVWYDMVQGVKHFEGFRAHAYTCCGGKRTIGYGHTGKAVAKGVISKQEATNLLEEELHKTKKVVLSIVKVPLTDYQLAALTSFTYNCGRGALYQLVSQEGRLNDGNYDSVAEVLPQYRIAGGKVRRGLVRRRAFELALWNNSVEHDNSLAMN